MKLVIEFPFKYKIEQFIERGRKGYCYADMWSWDNFFSSLVARSLKEFKSKCQSYPSCGITWEEWMKTLDEMIECFEEQNRGVDNIPTKPTDNPNIIEYDSEKAEERLIHRKEKLHRGLELLEKYYYDLWN